MPHHGLAAYIEIARIDHWIKNIFILPGFLVALSVDRGRIHQLDWLSVILGLLAICLISSSNYVLNEILDAPSDRFHPYKRQRPVPSGRVRIGPAYAEWLLLMLAGTTLAVRVSMPFAAAAAGLWIAGCAYNVAPLRAKDIAYIDVITEAVNNPIRMLAGWYLTGTAAIPITTLLASYWMIGCYFMAIKRYAEFRELGAEQLQAYRKSFSSYSESGLLTCIVFYAAGSMLFLGAFIARYRLELILGFPLIALVMAAYFRLAFRPQSPVQHPERLYHEPLIVVPVSACALVLGGLLFIDLPILRQWFPMTAVGF